MDIFNNGIFYMTVFIYGLAFQFFCIFRVLIKNPKLKESNFSFVYKDKDYIREGSMFLLCILSLTLAKKFEMFPLFIFVPFLRCLVYFGKLIVQDIEDKNSKFFIFITSVLFLFFQIILKQ